MSRLSVVIALLACGVVARYLRRGNTELVFHPGGHPLEVNAVDVRSAPVLGCTT